MTPDDARGLIAETMAIQSDLRDELIALLTDWSDGPTPPRARELFTEILRLDAEMDQLSGYLPAGE